MCDPADRGPSQTIERRGARRAHDATTGREDWWKGHGFIPLAVLALVTLACPNGDDGNGDPAAPLRNVDPSKAPPPTFRLMTWLRQSTTSDGGNLLRQGRPVAWFRWTFLDLDRHAQDCQWVRFLRALGYRRTAA